ncbi:MAG: nucleotidyltransferase domain-containing protein [Lachnospiraceae bacterium]|nr:nucleotidyltransferase domain-containing protein [Lachnospiraceae bacterium]
MYTIDEIKAKIEPIAIKYGLPKVYVFGSYARGEATENSDIDLLIDPINSKIISLLDFGGLYENVLDTFNKRVDIIELSDKFIDLDSLSNEFVEKVENERILLYER